MALTPLTLERVGGNTVKLFTYRTDDAAATVIAAGYFNNQDMANTIDRGDIITIVSTVSTAPVSTRRIVTSARGTVPIVTVGAG